MPLSTTQKSLCYTTSFLRWGKTPCKQGSTLGTQWIYTVE